jgi:hypothetical protein
MSLSYPEQKKALVEAVCEEEGGWDWADAEVWQAFFDENDETHRRLRRFVDVRRLRTFYGDRELDDGFADLGMDAYQYQHFTNKLFENLPRTLKLNSESFELALLESIGATFVTLDTVYVRTHDVYGGFLELKFTRKVYTDGRDDELVGPFEPDEVHDVIDEEGEWLEVSAGCFEDGSHDDAEPDAESEDQADYVPDLPDIPDVDKDMELRLTMGYAEDDEMSIPGYDEDTDSPERGLGDALYD